MTNPAKLLLAPALAAALACAGPTPAATPQTAGTPPTDAPTDPTSPQEAPALVVFVVVDQMRADHLTRYAEAWREGFKRLIEGGMVFHQASHDHAYTETAAGHATLSTGTYPSRHGIVGNEWSQEGDAGWRSTYAVEDAAAPIVDWPTLGGRSPANLLRTGLADWVQAADSDARVTSISTKDRAAITMAGKSGGHTYWVHESTGIFATSEYYRKDLPRWVRSFNEGVMPPLYQDTLWTSLVPAEAAPLSRPDTFPFEGDGVHTAFPHNGRLEARDTSDWAFLAWVREWTPRLDAASLELALRAVDELDLGQRGHTDFLSVSFSQVDYVGHRFGPFSREQLDNLLRLDHLLGRLMESLDSSVGEGRWVMALSSDHGVLELPEWRAQEGMAGARVTGDDLRAYRDALRSDIAQGGDVAAIRDRVEATARGTWFIDALYRHEDLLAGARPDTFAVLFRNSQYPGRTKGTLSRLGIMERQTEGTLMSDGAPYGTSHGSAYWYDRHVPLVFYGAGVRAGRSDEAVRTVDVAPSLAALAGISAPDDLDGRALVSR